MVTQEVVMVVSAVAIIMIMFGGMFSRAYTDRTDRVPKLDRSWLIRANGDQGSTKTSFPKIVWQTWKTKTPPKQWAGSPEAWKRLHPSWQYNLTTDDENRAFVVKHFPHLLETYDNLPYPIQRADYIRYMLLYVHGGVYCDLDIAPSIALDTLLDEFSDADIILLRNTNKGNRRGVGVTNELMVSKPGNAFWLKVMDAVKNSTYLEMYHYGKHSTVMNTTGPYMLTEVVRSIENNTFRVAFWDRADLFGCGLCDPQPCVGPVFTSYEGMSWNGMDSMLINFVNCHPFIFAFLFSFGLWWAYRRLACRR
jgi:inositol phosphorylceramide mannosyltransferase catalytic subunit